MRSITRRHLLQAGALGTLALLPWRLRAESRQPNLLFVLLDDLGAEALGCYGGLSYETPRLDALAASGLRFENCYASPTCVPSRVTTLTGLYPFRTGMDAPIHYAKDQALDPHLPTFATLLRSAGYRTAVAGKWQLARLDLHPEHPQRCGFDESLLWTWSVGDHVTKRYWGAEIVETGRSRTAGPDDYGPDLYCDFLADFVKRNRDAPFLAYYPMALVHGPFLPTPDDGTLAWLAGFEEARDAMASTAASRFLGQTWFASMVAYADKLVGRLVDLLDELGLREDTLVVVTGDNGTPSSIVSRLPEREVPGGKDTLTEAGTRVPMIASWPDRVDPGVADDLVDLSDLLPTFAELAGAERPSAGDGVSLLPRLLGGTPSPRTAAFAQRSERWFVRDRRWRLHHDDRLFDLRDRYAEQLADPGPEALEARKRLAAAIPIGTAARS